MSPKLRHGMLAGVAIVVLMFALVIAYAGSVTYTYDAAGNRTVLYDSAASPITTADPPGGTYYSA